MRDFPQNFVERDSKRGNWTVRRSRAGRVPLLQRVGFPDKLTAPAKAGAVSLSKNLPKRSRFQYNRGNGGVLYGKKSGEKTHAEKR